MRDRAKLGMASKGKLLGRLGCFGDDIMVLEARVDEMKDLHKREGPMRLGNEAF